MNQKNSISVIIPTLNEEGNIEKLLPFLQKHGEPYLQEIIVVDGESEDRTTEKASFLGAQVLISAQKCRASQLNMGAQAAKGDVLYFVHADALPPKSFASDIEKALEEGKRIGCYRFRFDSRKIMLRINSYFTRFPFLWCRGGDQTLFMEKDLFQKLNGFDERFVVMEDFDLIRRAKQKASFHVLPKSVIVSPRKYAKNSYLRVNIANLIVFRMFKRGVDPQRLKETYLSWIDHPTEAD